MKKTIVLAILLIVIVSLISAPVFATGDEETPGGSSVEELYTRMKGTDSLTERITSQEDGPTETQILSMIDERISHIVATVRVLATIFAVIFLIWMGLVFFTAGNNPQKLMGAKTQLVFFFISMLMIFLAEPIVRFVLSWFL